MGTLRQRINEKIPVTRKRHSDTATEIWEVLRSVVARVDRLEVAVRDHRIVLADQLYRIPLIEAPRSLAVADSNYSLDRCIARLRELAPAACREWERLLEVNATAYAGFPTDSCSVDGHKVADRFRGFLRPYLTGTVLDIGCGPQPVPSYLAGFPTTWIAGVDPLAAEHPFSFVQGTAEFLPWADGTFDTVVAATSLDHVLLLDVTFREIRRALKPGGVFVTWVSFVPGALPYNPYRPDVEPLDAYHLFHFDRDWFGAAVAADFDVIEMFDDSGSTFVSLRSKS